MRLTSITRRLHALAVRLHVGTLQATRRATVERTTRAVKQTRLVQEAIDKRVNELTAEHIAQSHLRNTTLTISEATVGSIDRELAQYEG